MEQVMSKRNLSTSSFKKNVAFIVKLLFAIFLLASYVNYILPQYEQSYDASLIDKVERIKTINKPKIVLLGNSNLTFGMNSELLEEQMGMPVVNMGLHGSCGNAFHENMAKLNINPGDIYIICHSDYRDDEEIQDAMTLWITVENHKNLWEILRIEDIKKLIDSSPIYLKKCLNLYASGTGNRDSGDMYSRSAFNKYGDVTLQRDGRVYTEESTVECPKVDNSTVERINRLNEYIISKGATLLIAGYPIGNGAKTANIKDFVAFQEELIQKLDCPVISNYVDYMLDYTYFYDYNYLHLNSEGANIRTEQLISDLKRWQQSGSDASFRFDECNNIFFDVNLSHIENIEDYLDALIFAKDRYTIIVSGKDEIYTTLDEELSSKLMKLGITADLSKEHYYSYIAVIERGNRLFEDFKHEKIEIEGTFDENRMSYKVISAGYDRGNLSSILLNGQEYSENTRGLNFVVYSNETHRILDEVTFDICSPELSVIR